MRQFIKVLSAVLLIFLFAATACRQPGGSNKEAIPDLVYTRHAKCRMACRHITEDEIKQILGEGHINGRKSVADSRPCPTFAYEGYTGQHQHLRIVIAKCPANWKVVTCIDLDNEFECNCN